MHTIGHWIGGRRVDGAAARRGPVFDPARGVQTGEVAFASAAEVDDAVKVAAAAAAEWRDSPLSRRSAAMFRLRELVDARRDDLAALITAEHGKVLDDARGEVARGLDCVEFACGIPHLLKGSHSSEVSTGIDVHTVLQPVGVVVGITPFNFPVMVPLWMLANALACGNAFVHKPSEKDPSASLLLAELVQRSRLPRRRAQRRAGRRRSGGRAARRTPTSTRCRSWAAPRSRVTSTRPAPSTASACRRSAARRTTWSCCPTPTSTPRPTPPSRPATDRPASAAWRSRWSSRWARSPTRWSTRSRRASPTSWSAPATTTRR